MIKADLASKQIMDFQVFSCYTNKYKGCDSNFAGPYLEGMFNRRTTKFTTFELGLIDFVLGISTTTD